MGKKGKVEKKRGRSKKPLTVKKEKELTSNIVDDNSNETEATEMGKRRKVTKRLTSNSVDDNVNDSSSSSSSPGTASKTVEAPPLEPPVQVKDAHSPNESTSGNLQVKEANVAGKGTSRIRQNPTTTPSRSLPPASPMVNKSSQHSEVIFDPNTGDSFHNVEGYKLKKEVAPLLKAIFSKYGDIAKESTFSSMESRLCLLELVCSIYKRLEASKFKLLTPLEIKSMFGQIRDLELVKVDVGWLHRKLDQISKAQQMYEGVSTFEDVKARNLLDITEKQNAVQIWEEANEACMAVAWKLQELVQQAKDELSAAQKFAEEINNIYD